MRFVTVKSEATQASAVVFRTRDVLVRQRMQIINALRGHLAEFGLVVAQGPAHVAKLFMTVHDPEHPLPEAVQPRRWENEQRLLIIGASVVVRWAVRKGPSAGSWLAGMLARKPPMLVRVAVANKMARVLWALMAKGGTYRAPAAAA